MRWLMPPDGMDATAAMVDAFLVAAGDIHSCDSDGLVSLKEEQVARGWSCSSRNVNPHAPLFNQHHRLSQRHRSSPQDHRLGILVDKTALASFLCSFVCLIEVDILASHHSDCFAGSVCRRRTFYSRHFFIYVGLDWYLYKAVINAQLLPATTLPLMFPNYRFSTHHEPQHEKTRPHCQTQRHSLRQPANSSSCTCIHPTATKTRTP